jgi:hypothetical protein
LGGQQLMNLKEVLLGTKLTKDEGKWNSGHIPPTAFPMSKVRSKSYKYGPEYKWRVIRFECVAQICRVLIVMNEGKNIFRATLGIEVGADMVVLCQHEYHASEPGWHCHLTFQDHLAVPAGAARQHLTRWPKYSAKHSKMKFNVNLQSAVTVAAERFRFKAQGDLL